MNSLSTTAMPTLSDHALELWTDHLSEQASTVRSATLALTSAPAGDWRETCAVVLTIELAKLRALIITAPAHVSITENFYTPHREAAAALAEIHSQS